MAGVHIASLSLVSDKGQAVNDRKSEPLAQSSAPAIDVLSDVLRAVRLSGAVFFDVQASCPWVAESPDSATVAPGLMPGAGHVIPFHVLTRGQCHAGLLDGDAVLLEAGDVVVFPHGDAHVLASAPGMRAPVDTESYRRAGYTRLPVKLSPGGGGEPLAHLICGFLGCDARPFNPLLEALPPMLVVRAQAPGSRWLETFVEVALAESRAASPGGETVLARLSELLFIEVVRRHVQSLPPGGSGWLAAQQDPAISRALGLLHAEPAAPWTLEALAQRCGLSRSVLAERFTQVVGQPPMQYLTRWRMQLAAGMLAAGGHKIAAVARQVGYDSEAAFSRAFKKHVGKSPSQWRG
ncbi:MAG: AraC family transcriptional regulator [Planctomycetes bacterium]|nr:AraC family transcriptional regulator [Planctomycetota bacterium]MCW8135580.1 AraC family transcriptional regulator [Planctomycetota bacterium]